MDYPCDQIGKRERQRADLFWGGLVTFHAPQCVLQMAQEGLRRFGKDLVFFQMMQADASTGGKGIETKVSPSVLVSLSFVSINEDGDREFNFYRNATADCSISKNEIHLDTIEKTKVFHFGSLSMTTDCAKEATLFAISVAKENGAIISFDPNYRPALWESVDSAIDAIICGCYLADIVKISDTELFLLSNSNNVIDAS